MHFLYKAKYFFRTLVGYKISGFFSFCLPFFSEYETATITVRN